MKGRKKLLGRRHESYFETLNLLVTICKAQDDHDTADVYQDLLPSNYHNHTEEPSLTAPSKDIFAIKTLSDNGYDINNKETYFEALDWASEGEHVTIVRFLLERGTDIHAHNEDGETMLFYACRHGFKDIASRLLDQGADIKAGGKSQTNLLNLAVKHESVLELLLDRGAEMEANSSSMFLWCPLAFAAKSNCTGSVRILIARGANVEGPEYVFETPLQAASRVGNVEIVRLLLDAGAKINSMIGYSRRIPLMYAALNGHVEVIKLLLERGADPQLRCGYSSNSTALDIAKANNHHEAVAVLKAAQTRGFKSR